MLYYNTVIKLLHDSLIKLMAAKEFEEFRLVGGTALSLQIGHRESVDIDLFTDADYGTIDFEELTRYLESSFLYIDHLTAPPALGKSYIIGTNQDKTVKLDVFYTDNFLQPPLIEDGIRMATLEEIIAMKIDVVQRGGRKKDFWDLHALFDSYSIAEMLDLHKNRYPYTHERNTIIENFTNFSQADDDFDPICLHGKYWEFIKDDIEQLVNSWRRSNKD